jgi:uncharacterized protein YuzB (UPF0349 family)
MTFRLVPKFVTAAVCVAALSACATSPATFAQKDPQVDVYEFKTFAFYSPAGTPTRGARYSTLVGEQLKGATRAQLERLGYVYDETNPDLRVNIMLSVRQRAEVRSAPATGRLPYRAWGASTVETTDYREGTLAIDLVDAKRRAMVWRGVTQDRITRKDMKDVDKTVRDAVRAVFSNYPSKA